MWKKSAWKGHLLYERYAFCKRQNYGDSKKIGGSQWLEGKEQDEQTECTGWGWGADSENNPVKELLYNNIIMDTCCYTFYQIYTMYTKSGWLCSDSRSLSTVKKKKCTTLVEDINNGEAIGCRGK